MDFCKPSGEICNSSATTRISLALSTEATSWQSVCKDPNESQTSFLEKGIVPLTSSAASYLIFFKVDIPQVKDGRQDSEEAVLVLEAEVQDLHGVEQPMKVF